MPLSCEQCDQIGIFIEGLGHNFSFKSGQNICQFLAYFEKRPILSKHCFVYTKGNFFGKGQFLIFNIWSHHYSLAASLSNSYWIHVWWFQIEHILTQSPNAFQNAMSHPGRTNDHWEDASLVHVLIGGQAEAMGPQSEVLWKIAHHKVVQPVRHTWKFDLEIFAAQCGWSWWGGGMKKISKKNFKIFHKSLTPMFDWWKNSFNFQEKWNIVQNDLKCYFAVGR